MVEDERDEILARCFSSKEIEAAGKPGNEHRLAGWFAVKEAILKALGYGFSNDLAFADIEVTHNELGAPKVNLVGSCLEVSNRAGIKSWLVSISHTDSNAIASVIGTT